MKRIITSLVLIIGLVWNAQAQLLPANQCESQTPCNARALCGSVINVPYSFITTPAFNPIGTCASSTGTFSYTSNWVYYRFTCYSTGIFNFRLNANDSASDLDWALWDITTSGCGSIGTSNVVSCNAAGAGPTGIQTGTAPAANFQPNITITAGSTYILGISNPLGVNTSGFSMQFSGTTANITDNRKPFMSSVLPFNPCSPINSIKIKLSEPVRCSQLGAPSVTPTFGAADFTISPSVPTYTVTPGANCPGCANAAPNTAPNFGNATDTATLTFASNIPPGTYTITPVVNAWYDLCGNSDSTTKTLVFTVPGTFHDSVRSGFDCVNLKYIDTVYGVFGTAPYQFKAVGGGLPTSAGTFTPSGTGYMVYSVSGGSSVTYTVKDNLGCETDTTITRPSVLALGAPNLSLSAGPPCNNQYSLDSLFVSSVSGGVPPYTFTAAPMLTGMTNPSPGLWKNLVFTSGVSFTVTVTDAYGCTRTGVRNLINPTVLSLPSPTATNPPCFGDSTGKLCFSALGGTPNYGYNISPSYPNVNLSTSPTCFNNLPAGTFTVTANDANGCTVTAVKTVGSPAVISINTTALTLTQPTCPNPCLGKYTPIATGGVGSKKYYLYPQISTSPNIWTDSVVASGGAFDTLCQGTYTVLAKDANGCTSTATFTLALPPIPVINVTTINPISCYGGTGSIVTNITNGTPTYTSASYTYSPSPITGVSVVASGTGGTTGTFSGLPAGTYDLMITNANGCKDTVTGVVMPQPSAPVTYASVVVDSVLCFGTSTGQITAQATGGTLGANTYQYSIKIGAAPFTAYSAPTLSPYVFTGLAAGTYTIRVKDNNGCTKDSVVSVKQPTKINLLVDSKDNTCLGTSNGQICVVDTGGTPGYQYKLGVAGTYTSPQPAALPYCYSGLAAGTFSIYTMDAKGCLDTVVSTITSIALPVVSFTAAPNDTVCDGTAITLCGTGANTYSWTGAITDCNAFVPTLGATTYTVTGTNSSTGCINTAVVNVLVNPIPVMVQPANQQVCNGVVILPIVLSSSVAGSTFTWTNNIPSIGLAASGSGNIPSFIAVNNGSTPVTATITVTPTGPSSTLCPGASISFTITVDPTPSVDPISNQQLCAGDFTSAVSFSGPVSGTTFTWANNNPAIGIAGPPPSNGVPSFQGTNAGNTSITGIFTVTPSGPAPTACPGPIANFNIRIDPLPVLSDPADQVVCNGAPTLPVNFVSSVANTVFTWTCNNTSIGLAASGTGNIPSFNAVNTSNVPVVATITIIPSGPVPTSCVGNTQSFTITVNPTPILSAIADETLCAGTATTGVVFSSTVSGTVFNWTNTNPAIGLGVSGSGTGIPSFTSTNAGSVPLTGVITVTPTANACQGNIVTYSITVDPIPVFTDPADQVLCESENTAAVTFVSTVLNTDFSWSCNNTSIGLAATGTGNIPSFTAVNNGTTPQVATITVTPIGPGATGCVGNIQSFTITVLPRQNSNFTYSSSTYCQTGSNPSPIFGAGATPGGIFSATPGGLVINSSTGLINLVASATGVTYTVKYVTPGPCKDSTTFNVLITLAPSASFSYASTTYCQNGIDPSPVFPPLSSGGAFSALPAGLSISSTTGIIDLSASNAGTYTVTNFIAAAGGCASATANTVVTIDTTTMIAPIANQTLCNNSIQLPTIISSTVAGSTYAWTNSDPSIGLAASGTGNIPSFTATNNGTTPVTATITITPTGPAPNFCTGLPHSYTITVNPTPNMTDPADQTLCSGDVTNSINFSCPVTGTTFSWTNSNTTIGLGAAGVGNIPAFTGTNAGNTSNCGIITVTPTANGCVGPNQNVSVCINPIPVLTDPADVAVCDNATTLPVIFVSSVANTSFSWTNSDPSIGLASSGNGNIPSFTATNPGNTPITAVITVTSAGPAPTFCDGNTQSFTITVNPTPFLDDLTDTTLCAGLSMAALPLSSSVSGTVCNWTNSNPAIGLGIGGTGSQIPAFNTTNATNAPISGTVSVTPIANACAGLTSSYIITVDPLPLMATPANQVLCESENTQNIIFTSNVNGSTFDWTNTDPSIGLATAGNGDILSFTAVNNGTTPVVATINVTVKGPGVTECEGNSVSFTITVNPRQNPSFTYPSTTYCQTSANPVPTFGAGANTSGTFTATPGGLSINASTGVINLSASAVNSYVVKYVTPGPCPDSATANITITNAPCATFTYASTSYCGNGTNPLPNFAALCSGGVFSSTAGLSINSATGEINLSASTPGTYTVTNNIAPAGGCAAASATTQVTIDPVPAVNAIPNQTICNGASTTAINISGGPVGTTYAWTNSNPSIGLPASGTSSTIASFVGVCGGSVPVQGVITVTPTGPAPNFCVGNPTTFTITVNPTPTVNTVSNQSVCVGAATTAVNFGSAVSGTTYSWTNSNPAIGIGAGPTPGNLGSFIATNAGTTAINGVFSVTPTAATCVGPVSTFTITVNPNATLTLTSAAATTNQTVCINTAITPITYLVGATGTNATVAGLPTNVNGAYNAGTHVITLSGTATVAGVYTYTITATGSCGSATSTGTITVSPLQNASFSYPQSTYCQSAANPSPTITGVGGGNFTFTPAGLSINGTTGLINLASSSVGTYTVTYTTPGPCPNSSTFVITIVTLPNASFTYSSTSYCQSAPNPSPIYAAGASAGNYTVTPSGLAWMPSPPAAQGTINLLGSSAGTYTITNTIAASGACPSVSATYTVTVTAKPTISVTTTTPASCAPGCDGTATTSVSGGAPAYAYSIVAPAGTGCNPNISALGVAGGIKSGTTYTITVTDANACSGTVTTTGTQYPNPTLSVTSQTNTTTPTNCDATANVSTTGGSPAYTYSFYSAPAGTPIINALGQATNLCDTCYVIKVTDIKGCWDTAQVCIQSPGLLLCSVPAATIVQVTCFGGNNGSFDANSTGGTAPITFSMSPLGANINATTGIATNLPAGAYTVTATDSNNIIANTIVNITQPAQITFTAPVIVTPSCSPGCDGSITITANGGTGSKTYAIQAPAGTGCGTPTQTSAGVFTGLGAGTYTIIATDVNNCTGSTTVIVNPSAPPAFVNVSHINPSCHDDCNGSITVVTNGGTPAINYTITSPTGSVCTPTQSSPTSGNFTTLGAGTYTITVTDSKNCSISTTVTLINPQLLVLNPPNAINPLCNGACNGTISNSATGGTGTLTYTLTPATGAPISNTTGSFTALCAGNYTITVTDTKGCTASASAGLTDPTVLSWTTATHTNIACFGQANGTISTQASGGVGTIEYSKNGTIFLPSGNFTGLLAGSYTITAKDANGCTLTTAFTIIEPPLLTLGAPAVQNVLCNGANNGSITIAANGGTPTYNYTLSPGGLTNSTGIFNNLPANTYSILVTDNSGCTSSVTGILITQPAPLQFSLVNHQNINCYGDATGSITVNTQGGTPSVTYNLIPNNGAQGPTGYFSGLIAGTYTVVATDANNCIISTVVTLTQGAQIVFANTSFTEPICHGDANGTISVTAFGGTGGLQFQLNGGGLQVDTVFRGLTAGLYAVNAVDALGCSVSTIVLVTEPDPVGAVVDARDANCVDTDDGKVFVTGTGGRGGYKYYVTPGLHINKSGIFTGLATGIYTLRVIDTSGCEYVTNFTIDPPANPLNDVITKTDLACYGVGNEGSATANVAGGTPPYTYLWSTKPQQTTAKATTLYFGYYDVIITDANGCEIRDTVYIEEGPCCDVAFIPNAFSPNGDQTNDEFRVLTTAGVELIQLEIYDRWGKRVWATIDYRKGWDGNIEGKQAPVDTYYYILRYKCTRDNGTYTKKGDVILIR
jgi:gliding motility-associated-like protein